MDTGGEFQKRAKLVRNALVATSQMCQNSARAEKLETWQRELLDLQRDLLTEMKELNKQKLEDEKLELIKLEWSLVGTVINRLLFFCFIVATFMVLIILIVAKIGS